MTQCQWCYLHLDSHGRNKAQHFLVGPNPDASFLALCEACFRDEAVTIKYYELRAATPEEIALHLVMED